MKNEKCTRCGAKDSIVFIPNDGERVCDICGKVYEERVIDETYEKRNFSSENSGGKVVESRISGPTRSGGNCLGTTLVDMRKEGGGSFRGNGGISGKSNADRGRDFISRTLGQMCVSQNLINATIEIFEKVSKEKKMKGRKFTCMVGAMYYIACRNENNAKTFTDIAGLMGLEPGKIIKAYKFIKNVVTIKMSPEEYNSIENIIQSFVQDHLKLVKPDTKILATEISRKINESCLLEGRNTRTIAGLSILIANLLLEGELKISDISKTFTSENTLKNVLGKIKDHLEDIIPKEYYCKIDNVRNY